MIKRLLLVLFCMAPTVCNAIVPLPGVGTQPYDEAGKKRLNVGRLITYKEANQTNTCTVTLIGQHNGVGIALTAAHCVDDFNQEAEKLSNSGRAGELPKCRAREVSFEAENTDQDPKKVPVIGIHAVSRFINNPQLFKGDLAVVYLDLSKQPGLNAVKLDDMFSEDDLEIPKAEVTGYGRTELSFQKEQRGSKLLEVVGYGQKHFLDGLEATKRRSMLTSAFLQRGESGGSRERNPELRMLLDSSTTKPVPGLPPVGRSPAQGDSGGPIIDRDNEHIVGVVSFAANKEGQNVVFALPLYPYLDWLKDQMDETLKGMVVTPFNTTKALMSDPNHWSVPQPLSICGHYGELNRIVEVNANQEVVADTETTPHAVILKGQNSKLSMSGRAVKFNTLKIQGVGTSVSSLSSSATLTVKDLDIEQTTSISSPMHVERSLALRRGSLDLATSGKHIRISEGGVLEINSGSDVKAESVRFDSSSDSKIKAFERKLAQGQKLFGPDEIPNRGVVNLSGTLSSTLPVEHSTHILSVADPSARINADYTISNLGILSLDISRGSPLTVSGDVSLAGGAVEINYESTLAPGDKVTLITAKNVDLRSNGGFVATSLVPKQKQNRTNEVPIVSPGYTLQWNTIEEPGKLKLSVVPSSGAPLSMGGVADEIILK